MLNPHRHVFELRLPCQTKIVSIGPTGSEASRLRCRGRNLTLRKTLDRNPCDRGSLIFHKMKNHSVPRVKREMRSCAIGGARSSPTVAVKPIEPLPTPARLLIMSSPRRFPNARRAVHLNYSCHQQVGSISGWSRVMQRVKLVGRHHRGQPKASRRRDVVEPERPIDPAMLLPCNVTLHHGCVDTTIQAGCEMRTLVAALEART